MAIGSAGTGDNLGKIKEQFKNCPLCEKEFNYPEYGDGPSEAIEIKMSGYYGSRHDCGSRTTYACDDCADVILALLKVFDLNAYYGIELYPELNANVVPERVRLLELRRRLTHALNISKNIHS